jgi:hypothetical protein
MLYSILPIIMTSLNNLEKLIQMATIEHMYSMVQKMKNEFTINDVEQKKTDTNNNNNGEPLDEIKCLKTEMKTLSEIVNLLLAKMEYLERELSEIKINTNNNSKYLCQQIRGEQVLSSYPGFSSEKTAEEEHIKLKIEEKTSQEEKINNKEHEEEQEEDEEEEQEVEDEEDEEEEDEEEEQEEEEQEEEEQEEEKQVNQNELEIAKKIEPETKEELEESEEEVETEEEVRTEEGEEQEEVEEPLEEEEEEPLEEEEEEPLEEEEEEEEVFEIEIDDITYFATHEENGILYEITKDGDVGKKVGIIKDGEPIFN